MSDLIPAKNFFPEMKNGLRSGKTFAVNDAPMDTLIELEEMEETERSGACEVYDWSSSSSSSSSGSGSHGDAYLPGRVHAIYSGAWNPLPQ